MPPTLHTPAPFKKGRSRRRVSAYPTDCIEYLWCVSRPLLRGVRGM